MRKKLFIFAVAFFILSGLITTVAWACGDKCHTKCANAFPSEWRLYQACMVGCCPPDL